MDFNDVLKELISLTGVMVKDISNVVQYDQSYISKWLSGAKLPTEKSLSYVVSQLSHYFSQIIVEKKLESRLRALIPVPLNVDHVGDVEKVIRGMLESGYYFSYANEQGDPEGVSTTKLVQGRAPAIQFTIEVIKRHLSYYDKPMDIVVTFDFLGLLPEINLETIDLVFTTPVDISVSTVLDMDGFEKAFSKRGRTLLTFLNQTINVNYHIYEDSKRAKNNVIVMKDHFVLLYYLNEDGDVGSCLYINDPEFVNLVYTDSKAQLVNEKIVLKSTSRQKLRNIDYDLDFIANGPHTFMTSANLGLFLDQQTLMDHEADIHPDSYPNLRFLNQLFIQYSYTRPMTLLTSRAFLLKFLRSGEVDFLGESFVLSKDERGRYMKNILRAIDTNPNLRIYIQQDDLSPLYTSKINLSMALTASKGIIMKNKKALYNQRLPYYMLTSQRFIDMLNKYVKMLMSSESARELTNEDAKELIQHYMMMFRMN